MASEFEQQLYQISNAMLQSKYPKIMDRVVGFNLVDYDEKESKGIGFFILNLSGKFFYVPVFFINGELKDIIICYNPKNKKFYPLTEDWINKIISRNNIPLGEGILNKPQTNLAPFDFHKMMTNVPNLYKGASANNELLFSFVEESTPMIKKAFFQIIKDNKNFLSYLKDNHGDQLVEKLSKCLGKKKRMQKKAEIEIIDDMEKVAGLTIEDKLSYMKDGKVIKDNREQSKLKTPYQANYKDLLVAPGKDGIYAIPTNEGNSKTLFIKNPFVMGEDRNYNEDMIVSLDSGDYGYAKPIDIMASIDKMDIEESIMDLKSSPITTMQKGKKYILYNHSESENKSTFSMPFEVLDKVKTKDAGFFKIRNIFSYEGYDDKTIHLRERDVFSRLGNNLFVPMSAMVVEVKERKLVPIKFNILEMNIKNDYDLVTGKDKSIFKNSFIVCRCDTELDAIVKMAEMFQLPIDKAREIFNTQKEYLVKKAVGNIPTNADYGLDNIPDHNEQLFNEELNVMDTLNNSGPVYNRGTQEEISRDIQTLLELSKNDIKVVDEGTIGVLSKLQDPGPIIKKFVPHWLQSLSDLGETLIVLWYHAYKVKDSFGINEYSQFEERIKDTFLNLGDIVLDVYKKDFDRLEL